MDIPRPNAARDRRRRRIITMATAVIVLAGVTAGLQRLKPAAPLVENPWPDTVKRGPFVRDVRGNGSLVPEEIRWVPAANAGRIENLPVLVGAAVKADTILVELVNPELTQAAFDAEWQLKGSEAELANLRVTLESQRLNQEAGAASLKSDYSLALLDAEADAKLLKDGLVAQLVAKRSQAKAEELGGRYDIEKRRLEIGLDSVKAQLAVQEARVEQMRALVELKRRQVESLKVRAGIDGVLQKLGDATQLQIGQQMPAGANLARVSNPNRLKAEVKINETQIKDVAIGQNASIDTRNGIIPGHVTRIDPASQNGTFTVDVALDGPLPRGARPDLSIDGTIVLEQLADVMFVGRPVHGQSETSISLFKVTPGGKEAIRVPVKLGRTSVSAVEILSGLQVGDQVILSDMSQWDAYDRVRLK